MIDAAQLEVSGYTTLPFERTRWLEEIRKAARAWFPGEPVRWHEQRDVSQEKHLELAYGFNTQITENGYVAKLLLDNLGAFCALLGPSLDIQTVPHVRVSRPEKEEDLVDWHRDVFYGNSPWELNLWIPIFPLEKGASLLYVEGSHLVPPHNVRDADDSNAFRRTVTKQSIAHHLGYVYAAKTDDSIEQMDADEVRHIAPAYGSAALFFGCGIHRAVNRSAATRFTVDVRLRDARAPTTTKPGYYSPLCRGLVERCAAKFNEA
jgi:hypothetical protein